MAGVKGIRRPFHRAGTFLLTNRGKIAPNRTLSHEGRRAENEISIDWEEDHPCIRSLFQANRSFRKKEAGAVRASKAEARRHRVMGLSGNFFLVVKPRVGP